MLISALLLHIPYGHSIHIWPFALSKSACKKGILDVSFKREELGSDGVELSFIVDLHLHVVEDEFATQMADLGCVLAVEDHVSAYVT